MESKLFKYFISDSSIHSYAEQLTTRYHTFFFFFYELAIKQYLWQFARNTYNRW